MRYRIDLIQCTISTFFRCKSNCRDIDVITREKNIRVCIYKKCLTERRVCPFLVAKKKSIFNDRQMEIEELTNIIKTDLKSLNHQIGKLQDIGRIQRESFSSSQGNHIASHSSSIVMALQSKLANMSNHFKSVLEVRSEV